MAKTQEQEKTLDEQIQDAQWDVDELICVLTDSEQGSSTKAIIKAEKDLDAAHAKLAALKKRKADGES